MLLGQKEIKTENIKLQTGIKITYLGNIIILRKVKNEKGKRFGRNEKNKLGGKRILN